MVVIVARGPRSENSDNVPPVVPEVRGSMRGLSGELPHRSRSVRIKNSGDQGHAHEIGEARSLHLDHEIGPVVLNRSRADAKIVRNLLVGMSSHQSLEDIAFAV